jgi:hypothetical protein
VKEARTSFEHIEDRVLRRTFEPKMDEVTGNWRKLQNEELHNSKFSPIK